MVVVRASGPDGASLVRSRPRRRWVGASIAGHTGTRHVCRVTAPVMIMVPRQRQGDRQSITCLLLSTVTARAGAVVASRRPAAASST